MIQTLLKTNTADIVDEVSTHGSFWRLWPWWSIPAVIGLGLVVLFIDPFIGDWDGVDYTILSVKGYPSSMALGRNLFIFCNHALFLIAQSLFHVKPENAYLIFKYAVVAQVPFAVIACWILAREVSDSVYTATIAALLIVFSPVFVLYGGQVMTDVPSVLILAVALIIHLRGIHQKRLLLILVGAGLMGLGVNLRETIAFYFPWLLLAPFVFNWKWERKYVIWVIASVAVFGILSLGWFAYWIATDPHYRWVWDGWRESMRDESARHPVSLANIRPYLVYLFISAPLVFVTIPFSPFMEWYKKRMSPMLLLWLVAFFADLLLFLNYSTTVNWRYFLTGLPGLVPLGGYWLLRSVAIPLGSMRRAFIACAILIASLATLFGIYMRPVSSEFIARRAMSKEYRTRLAQVPPDAVMISGSQTIAVNYWSAIGTGKWKTIGTGGGWPGDRLFSVIDDFLNQDRRVFIDADPRWWLPCGWQRDEIPLITKLEERYSFRRVSETIYELRPLGDPSARDNPNLKQLLPENRPEDIKKCPLRRT